MRYALRDSGLAWTLLALVGGVLPSVPRGVLMSPNSCIDLADVSFAGPPVGNKGTVSSPQELNANTMRY